MTEKCKVLRSRPPRCAPNSTKEKIKRKSYGNALTGFPKGGRLNGSLPLD